MAHQFTAVPGCTVETHCRERITVLSVSGTVDMLSAGALQDAADAALRDYPLTLIVDLTDVEFLASAGLSVLVAANEAAGSGVHFVVVAHGPATARPLALTGLTDVIEVHATLDEARRAAP